MVKPLNKEWELFGRKYRVPGAKGDKVNCNACQKQVSAAVNRLQSHLRVCPARATLPVSLLGLHPSPSTGGQLNSASDLVSSAGAAASLPDPTVGLSDATDLTDAGLSESTGAAELTASTVSTTAQSVAVSADGPALKRPRYSPSRARERARVGAGTSLDEFLLAGMSPPPAVAANSAAYAKRRLEMEEKRLALELKRDAREERRERIQLEILESQARKERQLAEKETYATKVLLALSRKQLRDQGVSQEEIDRVLPIDVASPTGLSSTEADTPDANNVDGGMSEEPDTEVKAFARMTDPPAADAAEC